MNNKIVLGFMSQMLGSTMIIKELKEKAAKDKPTRGTP